VRVRVIPEQSWALPAITGDAHFVVELRARMNVNEDIVAVALRRDAHAVIVQIRRIVRQLIAEADAHRVAGAHAQ
jgi:hypothetical protein